MSGPQLVIMAAGAGSRYGGLKQIDSIGPAGETVMDYSIYDALQAGFEKVIFIINRDIKKLFREKIGRSVEKRAETVYAFQELEALPDGFAPPAGRKKPWGTAHAVLCAKAEITGPFAVITADDVYGRNSFRIMSDHLRGAKDTDDAYDYSMVGFVLENTLTEHGHVARGICSVTEEGFLSSIVERTSIQRFGDVVKYAVSDDNWVEIPASSIVSMSMWGFTPGFIGELERGFLTFLKDNITDPKAEYFIPSVVNELLQKGAATVRVLPTDEKWLGVTYTEDKGGIKEAIARRISMGIYPKNLWGRDGEE